MTIPDASVVIGFRNWGTRRIRQSAQSVIEAFDGISAECIISDYGSSDPEPVRAVATELNAKYVYTSGDPNWSRSRALNAGFAIAEGKLLISTDADILFSPGSMRRIVEMAQKAEPCALFLQCRDLPEYMGEETFDEYRSIDWEELEAIGRLRPRWGMGGMMAIQRHGFLRIRGFDERLHTYGGEDLDFARRARFAGFRTVWIEDPRVRMYHMWHTPTIREVEQTEAGRLAVAFNKKVVYEDDTFVRNEVTWKHKPKSIPPLVSVVIATRDRSDLLSDAIASVLAQSVQDFELLVIDDGSTDDSTKTLVNSFQDSRIRYFRQENLGISAARNMALDLTRAQFTAVLDDDDLMPPMRLEWQLKSITSQYVGSVGSFVNFDNETGNLELVVSNYPSIEQAVEKGGAPGHGTWLIRTDVMRAIRYDATIPSGVDNNFFLRLLRSGYKIAHCGRPVLLRRRHGKQVSHVDSSNQGDAAAQVLRFVRFGLTDWRLKQIIEESKKSASYPDGDRASLIQSVQAYLPDHLVERNAKVQLSSTPVDLSKFEGVPEVRTLSKNGEKLTSQLTVRNASLKDLAMLASLGSPLECETVGNNEEADNEEIGWVVEALADFFQNSPSSSFIEVSVSSVAEADDRCSTSYQFSGNSSVQQIRVSTACSPAAIDETPWLVFGRTAKEYWK